MESIGQRLREERVRMGLSQDEFAALAGVQRRAQGMYERGQRAPDAMYLATVATHGVDVQYVLTGRRSVDVEAALRLLSDAWETLDKVLQANERNMPADKKRKAAEAMYEAVRTGEGDASRLASLFARAA